MKIGNIDLGNKPVMLAPMEDVTDIGFRLLCKQMGAAMVYSEFVSSDALIRMVNKSLAKLQVSQDERPVAIQIYGKDIGAMREAARIVVDQAHPDVLDLNFGCPVKKVAGKGAGSGMLQNVPLLLEITRAVVDAVPDTPVTVKTRLAWNHDTMYLPGGTPFIVDLAERLQDTGIHALTIHGRTRAQMYQGQADWTLIGKVRENPRIHIPIIGNGDICCRQDVERAFSQYHVDGVMVGRATFGCPWLFRDLLGKEPLTVDQKIDILKQQVTTSVERLGEYRGILHVRRHLAATPIFKGIPNFRETRISMLRAEHQDQLFQIIEDIRKILDFHETDIL
ncbi:MAG: tRNA-dihydrouridine synthase family protein [Bacteroidaceae bacterium]|nr:tRNA-dihydrouridine synthase family protein [Bacteroidaceae bacterium]